MEASVEKNVLVIRIPLQTPQASATGKTLVCATTRGNVKTSVLIDGKPLTIGLNAYISR